MEHSNTFWHHHSSKFVKICRVCLRMDDSNADIFDLDQHFYDPTGLELNFREKLETCCGIEVNQNDGLPTTVCNTCIFRINDANNLWKQCQQADETLRKSQYSLKSQMQFAGHSTYLQESEHDSMQKQIFVPEHYNNLYSSTPLSQNLYYNSISPPESENTNSEKENNEDDKRNSINYLKHDVDESINLTTKILDNGEHSENAVGIEAGCSSDSSGSENNTNASFLNSEIFGRNAHNKIIKSICPICYRTHDNVIDMFIHLNKCHRQTHLYEIFYILKEYRAQKNKFLSPLKENMLARDINRRKIPGLIKAWLIEEISESTNKPDHTCKFCDKVYISKGFLSNHLKANNCMLKKSSVK